MNGRNRISNLKSNKVKERNRIVVVNVFENQNFDCLSRLIIVALSFNLKMRNKKSFYLSNLIGRVEIFRGNFELLTTTKLLCILY